MVAGHLFAILDLLSSAAMVRRFVSQFLMLVLAVLVTAGLSLSGIQAATMPQSASMNDMSMMAGMDKPGDHGCKMCGSGASTGKAMVCGPICTGPLSASLKPAERSFVPQVLRFAAWEQWLAGRSQPPDPYPPRPFSIV